MLAIVIAFSIITNSLAQDSVPETLSLIHYTDENGLPQNSVKSIAGDAEGFIWLATENGIVRFDGQNFYNFDKTKLAVDNSRFYLIIPSMQKESGKQVRSRALFTTPDRENWVRIDRGTAKEDPQYRKVQVGRLPYYNLGYQQTMFTMGLPFYIHDAQLNYYIIPTAYGEGRFFVCTKQGVEFYNQWKKAGKRPVPGGSFWKYISLGGELYYYRANGSFTHLTARGREEWPVTGDILKDPAYQGDSSGTELYWNTAADQAFLYLNRNLYRLNPAGREFHSELVVTNFDLRSRNVKSIYYDQQHGTFYFGSITQGLYVLRKKAFETLLYPSQDEMDNVFYAQTPYGHDAVISPPGIVLGKDMSTGKPIHERVPFVTPSNWDTRGIAQDRKGNFWIKSGQFLSLFERQSNKLLKRWSFKDEIKSVYEDKQGRIWIGLWSAGLYTVDPAGPLSGPKLFIRDTFRKLSYISQRSESSMWIGTEHGLFLLDIPSRKVTAVPGTAQFFIKSIHVHSADETWISVADNGLYLLSGNTLIPLPVDKNKYLVAAHCIFEDRKGFFWVTTNKGLFKFSRRDLLDFAASRKVTGVPGSGGRSELYYEYYHKGDGFETNEFNGGCQPCAVRVPNGYVSLPSLKGLVWFKPEELDRSAQVTSLYFDRAEHAGGIVPVSGDTLRFPTGPKRVMLSFATPHFYHPYNLQMSYALLDANESRRVKDWVPMSNSDLSITFTSLNSGNYTLLVRKVTGFGANNYQVRKFVIIVPPLWYETWWARIFYLALAVLAIYFYNRLKLQKIKRENRKLEQKVAKRTLDLDKTLQDLKTSNNEVNRQLHVLSRLLTSMTHDFQTPLHYINRTSSEIGRLVGKGQYEMVTEIGDVIANSSQSMSSLMKDLLEYTKANVYGNSLTLEDIHLKKLTDAKYELFRNVIEQKNNRFINEIPDALTVHSDFHMLSIIIHNLIDNAAKFTKNGTIRVTAGRSGAGVHLTVMNEGTPIPAEIIAIFNQENSRYNGSNHSISGNNTGLGLLIIKEIAALIHVRIHVTQTDTTNFELQFSQQPVNTLN